MKWLNCTKIRLVLVVFVVAIVLGGGSANADFTFGTPTNLGPPIFEGSDPQGCCFSRDGLELYFCPLRHGGYGGWDIWVAEREAVDAPWGEPVNLGPNVNSTADEVEPAISPDGLELYFGFWSDYDIRVCTRTSKDAQWSKPELLGPPIGGYHNVQAEVSADGLSLYYASQQPGGYGGWDIWVSTRATTSDPWSEPINLGPTVNSTYGDTSPSISSDGLALFLVSTRPGGSGDGDIWVTTRPTRDTEWGPPVNYPSLNSSNLDFEPAISPDGSVLYFETPFVRWQSSITPIVDLNVDGIVDSADMCIMVDHWGENCSLCDIGPTPLGDGIVDVEDLIVLAEHLLTYPGAVAYWKLDEAEGNIAYDSIGNNDGTVNGDPAWQRESGVVDGALELDGIDDYVSTTFVLNPADGAFSVFAWIKGGAPGQAVLSQTGSVSWLCTDASEGNLMTELKGSGRSAGALLSQMVITDGNWHRIGLVWDGSHRTLYVDDILAAQDTQDGMEGSDSGLYIGTGKAMEPGTFWSGLIDDVRIYNRAVRP
ncbi:MAG: PD40 domain-containing protein [Phycisphaerae bacterium]|nr:PD40 domain-containing protein [Phycisphaerae bacterium]